MRTHLLGALLLALLVRAETERVVDPRPENHRDVGTTLGANGDATPRPGTGPGTVWAGIQQLLGVRPKLPTTTTGRPTQADPTAAPAPRVLEELRRLAHDLRSGNVTIVDERSFRIPRLHYDGLGPDAYFIVGKGRTPSRRGRKLPDETGSLSPLKRYTGETITIELPQDLTMHDIGYLAMYCFRFRHNFGHVFIPKDLNVPPAQSKP